MSYKINMYGGSLAPITLTSIQQAYPDRDYFRIVVKNASTCYSAYVIPCSADSLLNGAF